MEQDPEGHESITSIKPEKEESGISLENSSVNLPFLAAGLVQTAAAITFSKLSADFFRFALTTNPRSCDIRNSDLPDINISCNKSEKKRNESKKMDEVPYTSTFFNIPTTNRDTSNSIVDPLLRLEPNFFNSVDCSGLLSNALSLVQSLNLPQLSGNSIFRKQATPPVCLTASDSLFYPTFEENFIQTEAQDLSLSKKPEQDFTNSIRPSSPNYQSRFKCLFPGCKKAFPFQYHLTNHFRIHTGEKPYKCNHPGCSFAFARQSSLLNHKVVHIERGLRRVFSCLVEGCGKSFLKPTSLSDHMNVHLGKRPYVCGEPGCGRAFRCRSNLSGHRRVHFRDRKQESKKFNNESKKILIPRLN